MSIGQRRPFEAGDPHRLEQVLPPPPGFWQTHWRWPPGRIRRAQEGRLARRLAEAAEIPFYRRLWEDAGFEPDDFGGLEDLSAVPAYTVGDIRESIERDPPLGDYQATSIDDARREPVRLFFSGGTTGRPRPTLYTQWDRDVHGILLARHLHMQGIRPGDVVLNAWTYGTHNGAHAYDEALYRWLNCVVITTSAGTVTSSRKQVRLAHDYDAAAVLTTGDYLLRLAEVAEDMGLDPREDLSLRALPNIGDPDALEEVFGIRPLRTYGFHEVGAVAVECPAREGLHVFEDAFVVEVVDPQTGERQPDGELGSLVVTELCKTGNAQIRYDIQDLSWTYPRGRCDCGSWFRRIAPFQGRGDNMIRLRGVNLWPEGIGRVARTVDGVGDDYFVRREDAADGEAVTVLVTATVPRDDWGHLAGAVRDRLRAELGVRIGAQVVTREHMDELTGAGRRAKLRRFEDDR